jgi:hypothetical protein
VKIRANGETSPNLVALFASRVSPIFSKPLYHGCVINVAIKHTLRRCQPTLQNNNFPFNVDALFPPAAAFARQTRKISAAHFFFCNFVKGRVARFLLLQHTKMGNILPYKNKIYQMTEKYTKWT